MSSVANVMMSIPVDRENLGSLAELNEWMRARRAHGMDEFRPLTGRDSGINWGGSKNPEAHVYGAALNHWDLRALVTKIEKMKWSAPNCVQVFIQDQDDWSFGVWMYRQGKLMEVVPRESIGEPALPFNAIWDEHH